MAQKTWVEQGKCSLEAWYTEFLSAANCFNLDVVTALFLKSLLAADC